MTQDTEIIVIGSGIGGLCCAGLLARYGFEVTVLESHVIAGGAAHSFVRDGYHFDSGPSLYSGLSYSPSSNPLRQVLDLLEEDCDWLTYDAWGVHLPEGYFRAGVGADGFCDLLIELGKEDVISQWRSLQEKMRPLGEASVKLPLAAFREDLGAILTVGKYAKELLPYLPYAPKLNAPFGNIMDQAVTDPFIRNWLDLLSFMLSGLPASGTVCAEMAFMFAEWYRPEVLLDYPKGGSGAIVDALVRGLKKFGGDIKLNSHVSEILIENGTAKGVKLKNGEAIRARRAVVSNASIWDTLGLIEQKKLPQKFIKKRQEMKPCRSFMHLHLGIDATDLPAETECHYLIVNDWDRGVDAEQNVVAVSIPSILDPSLAPVGKHGVHVYLPATEPYELWEGQSRNSESYLALKEERTRVMWQSLEKVMPDIRQRTELELIGTPLTHERFLRRHRGSYGPELVAGKERFPGCTTPISGLFCCGDSTFPGIGVPAVAGSGIIAANTIAPLGNHLQILQAIAP
ncbi:MAG: FAD-dependent oxidoreductase [Limnothrix sp. RL_2_0]|nr:FAD-dependent oxidoreductase [Limnothrix sp. RL_2_0]